MSEGSPPEEFGPYIVYEQLGVGGMAQVHRAIAMNDALQRPVALKRMLSHIADSQEMVKSFVREAQLASHLRHENVAQTYDLGKVGDTYFIVMELITGRNLRRVLRHCAKTTGVMPVQIALNILNQICDALHYAHNLCDEAGQPLGIIHRDVSPSNVIVSETGVVKLIDFGIAKVQSRATQTRSGTLKGKFAYMAPEYLEGQLDARADLFAVGVIAHELLTNRPLFSGRDDIDTLRRVRSMHIDPPSKHNPLVPPEIDDIVMTALARDPERRWQHATALRTALTTLTQRLNLVATNTEAIQWLDWAFTHTSKLPPPTDADTQIDSKPVPQDDPSILVESTTIDPSLMTQNTTLVRDADPAPPARTPFGTPAYPPATVAEPAHPTAADHDHRINNPVPQVTINAGVPPVARSSAPHLARARSPSVLPSPGAIIPVTLPGLPPVAAPVPVAQSFHAAPVPMPQGFHGAPSSTPYPPAPAYSPGPPPPYAPARSEMEQRDFAQQGFAPSTAAPVPARRSYVWTVVLVIFAAAIAAITVAFLVPLLT